MNKQIQAKLFKIITILPITKTLSFAEKSSNSRPTQNSPPTFITTHHTYYTTIESTHRHE
jgi:hypothetical protein